MLPGQLQSYSSSQLLVQQLAIYVPSYLPTSTMENGFLCSNAEGKKPLIALFYMATLAKKKKKKGERQT